MGIKAFKIDNTMRLLTQSPINAAHPFVMKASRAAIPAEMAATNGGAQSGAVVIVTATDSTEWLG